MDTMIAPCSQCFRETHQKVLHQVVHTLEDEVTHEVYRLLECAGCRGISMAHLSFYDEGRRYCTRQRYYPTAATRKTPAWRSKLPFGVELFDEIYQAVGAGQYRLAVMGIRALLEQVMISNVGDQGSFERNLNIFCERGYISIKQRDSMNDILDAGHATIHRRFNPKESDVSTGLDITENVLAAIYVHGEAAASVADRVPPRPPPRTKRSSKP
jgi:Domain of unknown function (DUF4145)